MLRIISGLLFITLFGIIAYLIHPILVLVWVGVPIAGVLYNLNRKN